MKTPTVLIIDDDLRMRQLVGDILREDGIDPVLSGDSRAAIRLIDSERFDIVITDLKMPDVDGIGVLERARDVNPDTTVVVITGYGTVESAIEAMKKGAYDYIQKPFEPDEFLMVVRRVLEHVRLVNENKRLLKEVEECTYEELVGTSKAINDVKGLIARIAPFDTTVLIQGETGTGKELVARLIHKGSKRNKEKFLPVNCGAIAESLLEAELFGYEKGAFTGAEREKAGLFESVHGGTIFLDEISATTTNFQVKLLRVLQEGCFLRVGGTEERSIDVRIVTASNARLDKEVEAGTFRSDLFYRLNVLTVEIPPLRKRKEDIPLLAYRFLSKCSNKYHKKPSSISTGVLKRLIEYSWPGNVRELENVIERAVIMENGDTLKSIHLPGASKRDMHFQDMCSELMTLDAMEAAVIQRTLTSLHGQKTKAAEVLGISSTSLWRKIKKYKLG